MTAASDDTHGDLLTGAGQRPAMGWGALLSFIGLHAPGAATVPPAMIPPPPVLDGLDDEATWTRHLLHAWFVAVASRYPARAAHLRTPKGYDEGAKRNALLTCAHMLFGEGIAPAAWAAFITDRWRAGYAPPGVKPAVTPPSPSFVYRPDAMTKSLHMFRQTGAGYAGGRVVLGPKYRALHALWDALHVAMLKARVRDVDDARVVATRLFGDDLQGWHRAVWDARVEARAMQQRFNDDTTKGHWSW